MPLQPIKPTYTSAVEQMRAHRILRGHVQSVLAPYAINASQWAILGSLYDRPEGMRPTDIANLLEVKAPLITLLVGPLFARSLIDRGEQLPDKRARTITLTASGRSMVEEAEDLLAALGPLLFKGISSSEMATYHKILQAIIASEPASGI